jgi:molybdopterin synthase catalytic subunit
VTLNVLFFAQARDRAGISRIALELPAGSRVADALRAVREKYPALEPLWPHLAVALNGELAPADTMLSEGVELALLPPVSGG